MKESSAVGHDLKPATKENPCLYYEESMADSALRARREGDYICLLCGGVYSIRNGGRPAACKRPRRDK